jgi:hypothetical protein
MRTRDVAVAMVTYQFRIDEETWTEWKRTVPREKSLETRIIELVEADRDGRVRPPEPTVEDGSSEPTTPTPQESGSGFHDAETVVAWVREHQPAGRAEIVAEFHDDSLPVNEKTWWENYARESLKEAGFEFVRNQGWQELD